jgi:hypothetical protein
MLKISILFTSSQRLERLLPQLKRMYRGTNSREGREMFTKVQSPDLTRQELLHYHTLASQGRVDDISASIRQKRQGKNLTKSLNQKSRWL